MTVLGFDQMRIFQFIDRYFRAIGSDNSSSHFRHLMEKNEKYGRLATRPLFCVLLCMLYVTGSDANRAGSSRPDFRLPDRQSDVVLQIILCLIKWNRKNTGNSEIDFDSLPSEYDKPFSSFGKLCVRSLSQDKSRFSQREVEQVSGFHTRLEPLGFLYSDNESHVLGEKRFWKPVHQTFIEYLAAFYISRHVRDCKNCKDCKQFNSTFQKSIEVLKFCVGILNNKASKILDATAFPILWSLKPATLLHLLKECDHRFEKLISLVMIKKVCSSLQK